MAVAVLVGAIVFCGALGGVLAPLLLSRVSGGGLGALANTSVLPAFALLALVIDRCRLGRSVAWASTARLSSARPVRVREGADGARCTPIRRGTRRVAGACSARGCSRVVLVRIWLAGAACRRQPGLVEAASADELGAVIEHERYHVQNLDPLKIVLTRSLSAALFFLPVLDALRARYIADCELAADRQAIARCGDRSLAGALVKAIRGPNWDELSVAASIGGPDLLDVRVVQLETGIEPRLAAIDHRHVALSILSTALFVAAYLVSAYSLGGPAAVYHTTGNTLASATVLGGLVCAVPFAAVGISLYLLIAIPAKRSVR